MSTRGSQKRKHNRVDGDSGGSNGSSTSLQDDGTRPASVIVSIQESNIANVKPEVGMTLEIRDSDYIWSSARLVNVKKDGERIHVTVRCDGWGAKWDEILPWPCERLARRYTYTKKVKCFLSLFPKPRRRKGLPKELLNAKKSVRKVYSNFWPCTVQFRMPHPFREGCTDEEQCLRAEQLLELEPNVFVQPYGVSFLPDYIKSSLDEDGGRWFHNNRLRLWKDDLTGLGVLPKHFEFAFEEASRDSEVPGFLPQKALVEGSLLDDAYRVRTADGEDSRGVLVPNPDMRCSASSQKPPLVVKVRAQVAGEDSEQKFPSQTMYEPAPALPEPVRITEPVYPGVTRCKNSNQWVASVSSGGNDIFLGTFPTQTHAWNATKIGAARDLQHVEQPADLEAARRADLLAVPIETIVDASERQRPSSGGDFSLHEWTIQHIRHQVCRSEDSKFSAEEGSLAEQAETDQVTTERKRKGRPRKLDLARGYFIRERKIDQAS